MPQKKTARIVTESLGTSHEFDNSNTRSGFGDNHAATEDAMMVAHAKHMLKSRQIDEKMAVELSKPRRNLTEVHVKYSAKYLAMHPDYTGHNHHKMPSLETALQRQKMKDDAMLKQLEDYKAGRIDLNGNAIGGESDSSSSPQSFSGHEEERGGRDHPPLSNARKTSSKRVCLPGNGYTGDTTVTASDSSDDSRRQVLPRDRVQGIREAPRTSDASAPAVTIEKATSEDMLMKSTSNFVSPPSTFRTTPVLTETTPLSQHQLLTTAPSSPQLSPSKTTSQVSTPTPPRSSRSKRNKRNIPPLTPLPGFPTYANYNYYELAAFCRSRRIPSRGNEQEVRNTLIRDDTNVTKGLPREKNKSQPRRREYKHYAPEELKVGVGSKKKEMKKGKNEKEEKKEVKVSEGWWEVVMDVGGVQESVEKGEGVEKPQQEQQQDQGQDQHPLQYQRSTYKTNGKSKKSVSIPGGKRKAEDRDDDAQHSDDDDAREALAKRQKL